MSYHIPSDNHWRISKSGYSIKTGFADNSRIVASYHAPHTQFDGPRFKRWLEDAQHACDLHNASIDESARADARIAELVDLLTECRDCVASDINYTTAQSWHQPATVDYLDALLARTDAAIAAARAGGGESGA